MIYSNPRTEAVIPDWPSGRHRTTATFRIEQHPTRGERGTRTTTDPKTGRESKPKLLTYATKARIVDGDDGKTYIVNLSRSYGLITVMQSNMQFQQEAIFERDPRYSEMLALFN
jgi:hypothetical protein